MAQESNGTRNMKNEKLVPKDFQRILSSHKIWEKCNEQKVFCKKAVLKNFVILTSKHLCGSLFLIKMLTFRPATLLRRNCNTGVFLRILQIF